MSHDFTRMDCVAILSAFRDGWLSPHSYAEYVAEAAMQFGNLNSLQNFEPDDLFLSVEAAVRDHADGDLTGLPLVVKDNINTTNYPTSGGTSALLDHTPVSNAGVVKALLGQGGVIGAKSTMHELAFGITSNNSVTGPVRNPRNPDLISGGSSGGTAAAIAAGIFPAGLGTDTGGSCRIPAALCGVVGFRPTTGRYDSSGLIRICHTRDTVGSLARSVRDIVLLDNVMGVDKSDLVDLDLSSIVLGVPRHVFFDNLEPAVEAAVEAQIDALAAAGAKIKEVDLSSVWPHNDAFSSTVVLFEVLKNLQAYLSEHASDVSLLDLVKGIVSPDVAGAVGSQLGADAVPEKAYREAQDTHRPAMRAIYAKTFADNGLDAIVFPTTPLTARPVGEDETVDLNGEQVPTFPAYIRNTDLGSNLGVPGISIPCPVGIDELPVGIEFDGVIGQDKKLLSIATAAERLMN